MTCQSETKLALGKVQSKLRVSANVGVGFVVRGAGSFRGRTVCVAVKALANLVLLPEELLLVGDGVPNVH